MVVVICLVVVGGVGDVEDFGDLLVVGSGGIGMVVGWGDYGVWCDVWGYVLFFVGLLWVRFVLGWVLDGWLCWYVVYYSVFGVDQYGIIKWQLCNVVG